MLVVFFGDAYSVWQSPEELLPFDQYQTEKELAASALASDHKLPKTKLFQIGLKVIVDILSA